MKVPPKRKFVQSTKKGRTGARSQKKEKRPGSPIKDEDNENAEEMQRTLDDSLDSDYISHEDFDVHEVTADKKPRRSNILTKKPE